MTDPASQHPYMYCGGNPISYSDPSGYEPISIGVGIGALTAVGIGYYGHYYGKTYQARKYGEMYAPSYQDAELTAKYAILKGAYSSKNSKILAVTISWYYNHYGKLTDSSCEKAANRAYNALSERFGKTDYPFTFVRTRIVTPGNPNPSNPYNIIAIVPRDKASKMQIDPYNSYTSGVNDLNDYTVILYPGSEPIHPVYSLNELR